MKIPSWPISWPVFSLLFFLLVLPWSLALMQIGLVLVVLSHLIAAKLYGRPVVRWQSLFWFPAGYMAWRVFSVLMAPDPWYSLKAFWATDWVLFLVPLLASLSLSPKEIKISLKVLLVSASLAAGYGIFQSLYGVDPIRGIGLAGMGKFFRATGGYNFYLTFAGNQFLAYALALGLFLGYRQDRKTRLWLAIVLALITLSIVGTFARSIWLALFFSTLLGLWLAEKRWFWPGLLLSATIGVLLVISFPEVRERLLSIFELSANENRLNLWRTALRMIQSNPIWGIGPGMFNEVFDLYKVPGFYDAYGHAHNDYLNVALNSGLPALVAWLSIWFSWLTRGFSLWRKQAHKLPSLDRGLLLGCLLGMVGMLIASIFQCYYTDLENNIFWWFLYALGANLFARITQPQEAPVSASA